MMMMMKSRTLEITILSAENLQSNKKPLKKNSFVTVRTDATLKVHRTAETDCEGGGPRWNEKLVVELPAGARSLYVQVQCQNGAKTVGAASIPVTDFVGEWVPENYLHFLSYRLRDERGVRNGIVNVSVRMKVEHEGGAMTSANYGRTKGGSSSGCATTTSSSHTKVGYPVAVDNGGVVTGIPVNWQGGRQHYY